MCQRRLFDRAVVMMSRLDHQKGASSHSKCHTTLPMVFQLDCTQAWHDSITFGTYFQQDSSLLTSMHDISSTTFGSQISSCNSSLKLKSFVPSFLYTLLESSQISPPMVQYINHTFCDQAFNLKFQIYNSHLLYLKIQFSFQHELVGHIRQKTNCFLKSLYLFVDSLSTHGTVIFESFFQP